MKQRHFDIFCQALVFAAAASILTPLELLLFSGVLWNAWLLPGICAVLILLGYLMQALCGRIAGRRRLLEPESASYEQEGGFRLSYAAVPTLISAVLSALSLPLFREMYYYRVLDTYASYQPDSPFPYMAAIGMFLALLAGVALWFYPPEKLIGARYFLSSCVAIILLLAVMAVSGMSFGILGALCFAVFTVSSIILLNQTYISRDYHGTVSVITPQARLYNLRLILLLLGGAVILFALSATVIAGIVTLARMIFFSVLYQLLRDDSDTVDRYLDPEVAGADFHRAVFRDSPWLNTAFYIFVLLVVLFVFWFLFRRSSLLRNALAAIRKWIADFISFWMVAKEMWTVTPVEILNYKDETTQLQNASIRDYTAMAERTDLYEDFLRRVRTLPDVDAQLTFAYLTMLRALRKKNIPLKISDTPRECCEKIRRSDAADVAEITDALEQIKYAQEDPARRGEDTLRAVCRIVKKYLA